MISETREVVGNVMFEKYKEALQPLQFDEYNMSKKGAYTQYNLSRRHD